ncbi:unnamed protein product [Trifolium pratense]|uniref:Uncharacterized protein n=1 Tax=Trifolium pratense TaxID=57577 RepID=A0ACB0IFE8_TRIPR|nr:unnamed protein product [Trifolium pratense]
MNSLKESSISKKQAPIEGSDHRFRWRLFDKTERNCKCEKKSLTYSVCLMAHWQIKQCYLQDNNCGRRQYQSYLEVSALE